MAKGFDKSAITQQRSKQNPIEKREQEQKAKEEQRAAKPKQDLKYKSVRIYPDDIKLLKTIAFKHDVTMVQLIEEAVFDLKKKYENQYGNKYDI